MVTPVSGSPVALGLFYTRCLDAHPAGAAARASGLPPGALPEREMTAQRVLESLRQRDQEERLHEIYQSAAQTLAAWRVRRQGRRRLCV